MLRRRDEVQIGALFSAVDGGGKVVKGTVVNLKWFRDKSQYQRERDLLMHFNGGHRDAFGKPYDPPY